MKWIEAGVGFVSEFVSKFMPDGMLKDLLVDGVISGVGSVIVFYLTSSSYSSLLHLWKIQDTWQGLPL